MIELVALLQRQFAYVARQPEGRLLLVIPRLVGFILSEARLRAIVDDLLLEHAEAMRAYQDVDRQLARRLNDLWALHGVWFLSAWDAEVAAAPENPAWKAWGDPPTTLMARLAKAGEHHVEVFGETADPSAIGGVLQSMEHWIACVKERIAWGAEEEPQSSFLATFRQTSSDHDRARRAFLVADRTAPGAAELLPHTGGGRTPEAEVQ